jgi:nicotinamide-nucleotide amidase
VAAVADIIAELAARGLTIAVAESLTGGLLAAELIKPPGASDVVLGGVVAYNTELKATLLGVDPALLAEHGPVHPDVAKAMARNVRERLAVGGRAADVGISTTGVAGPDPVHGHPPGVVYLGLSVGLRSQAQRLDLSGTRDEIRALTVAAAVEWISETLERGLVKQRE